MKTKSKKSAPKKVQRLTAEERAAIEALASAPDLNVLQDVAKFATAVRTAAWKVSSFAGSGNADSRLFDRAINNMAKLGHSIYVAVDGWFTQPDGGDRGLLIMPVPMVSLVDAVANGRLPMFTSKPLGAPKARKGSRKRAA